MEIEVLSLEENTKHWQTKINHNFEKILETLEALDIVMMAHSKQLNHLKEMLNDR